MLRKFKIAIDGKEYLVEMEELDVQTNQPLNQPSMPAGGIEATAPKPTNPVMPTPPAQVAPPVGNNQAAPSTSQEALLAPMPGNILKILVEVGQKVEENQPMLILEAMKMENEIVADKSGVVQTIYVTQGTMVNPGDPLVLIS